MGRSHNAKIELLQNQRCPEPEGETAVYFPSALAVDSETAAGFDSERFPISSSPRLFRARGPTEDQRIIAPPTIIPAAPGPRNGEYVSSDGKSTPRGFNEQTQDFLCIGSEIRKKGGHTRCVVIVMAKYAAAMLEGTRTRERPN